MSSHPTPGDSSKPTQQLELGEDESAIALRKAWDKTLRALVSKFNKPTFENFLKPLKPLSLQDDIVVLGAPSSFAREWAEKKYSHELRGHLQQFLDRPALQVRFVISTPDVQPLLGEKPLPLQQAAAPHVEDAAPRSLAPSPSAPNGLALELAASSLNEKYTFDQFVEGKSNRLAYAGAMNVAQSPGMRYNPLFLYGSPGLGKTHLMHAIGHHVRLTLPQSRVAYVSGESFTNHYVAAIRDKRTEDFRRAYRSVDVWLVDDIQTIASKEQTKEEFFHTFNTLYQMNRQIVITSDRSPRELRMMDERLWSRFECGLVADIGPPELEMRQAILQKKALLENLHIPDEVIAFMADLIQSNIRALEGALIKLMAYASLAKSPVTKQLASDVLSGYYVERAASTHRETASAHPGDYPLALTGPNQHHAHPMSIAGPTVDQIIDAVAAQTGVDRAQILSGGMRAGRNGKLHHDPAWARQAAMYLAKEICKVPMSTLAAAFGCKTHAAVAHAHARMKESLQEDPQVLSVISKIQKVIEYSL